MTTPFLHTAPDMLYIHWPFCASKCTYCDFVAIQDQNEHMQAYHEALCNQVRHFVATRPHVKKHPLKTIFFGGGTPSLYPLPLLRELFALLHESFDMSEVEEISLEVNPGGQTDEEFATWKECGINRLSVGVQVLDENILKRFKRFQANRDVQGFFDRAPAYIPNLSADMIIGLPGVTDQIWQKTIHTALTWPINHFSLYFLTVHEHTPLYYGVKKGAIVLPKDDTVISQYEWTMKCLESAGFMQYEISNFARPGGESRHNRGYWRRLTYKGFGLGAASFDGNYRFSNVKKLGTFIGTFSTASSDVADQYATFEQLSSEQVRTEIVMLGMRQRQGISLEELAAHTTHEQLDRFMKQERILRHEGCVESDGKQVWLTHYGILYENEVVARLCHAFDASS